MRKGGYKVINLNDNNLTTSNTTITGIYKDIKSNYRKAILLSGITINGVEYSDCFTTFNVSGSNLIATVYNNTITITDTDIVTATAIES